VGIRRYRLKYSVSPPDGSYITKTKEFASLRQAGEWVRDMPKDHAFVEIRALDIGPLDEQEKGVFAFFTDGKIILS
jgi:hypothetical protein